MSLVIKNIIKNACQYLQKKDIVAVIDEEEEATDDTQAVIDDLVMICNKVIQEIATDYLPCVAYEYVEVEVGCFDISDLENTLLAIKFIKTSKLSNVKFEVYGTSVIIKNGSYVIAYSYLPDELVFTDSISDFSFRLTDRVISYGVVSEYFAINGQYDDSYIWEKRFREGLSCANQRLDSIVMRGRAWV